MDVALTRRWTIMKPHAPQLAYRSSPARFNVVPAGRRSGKTERFKRKIILSALGHDKPWNGNYAACAPTRDQAKAIYWNDLKAMIPQELMLGAPRESELVIKLINGSEIAVIGMDRPMRVEGRPWDGMGLDEFANMKPEAWEHNVRPALSDRLGWCDFIGVPEGRNHYYQLYQRALHDTSGQWAAFTWFSSDILPPEEIASARADLDELTFAQEYEASFVSFTGCAYYNFNERDHYRKCRELYNPDAPLIFAFDFNVAPGVANILQEMPHPALRGLARTAAKNVTACIGEVHIPRNSTTVAVCAKLLADWGKHRGRVICYGDASGGNKGSAKLLGSDWDIVRDELHQIYRNRLSFRVKKANPSERARVNAVNTRLKTATGEVSFVIDPSCRYTIQDFEGVVVLQGGSGELDKAHSPDLTHHTDAIGYYIEREYPTSHTGIKVEELSL